jgi:ribosomal-protein-alanine N-acetyltransferase
VAIDSRSFLQPWSRASFDSAFADPEKTIVLVIDEFTSNGPIIRAFGVAWTVGDESEIATIAVDTPARGRGLGKMMMHELVAQCISRGAQTLYLEVRPSNEAARRLYLDMGWVEVGKRPNYYANGETALIMCFDTVCKL